MEYFMEQDANIKKKEGAKVETLVTKQEMMATAIKSPDMVASIVQQYSTTVPTLTTKAESLLMSFPVLVDENVL